MAIYLKNGLYFDWETLVPKNSHIRVNEGENGTIEFIDSIPLDLPAGDSVIECRGRLVMKAFGCAHHHVYSALARGMPPPRRSPRDFHEILKYIWWHLDKNLDLDMIEVSALVTAMYCAKNGVTFVIDHHSSPHAVNGSLFAIAAAFDRVGISHLLCYELSDRDGKACRDRGLEETEDYLKSGNRGLVGLHASFTVGDELLKKTVDLTVKYDSGIHVHAAEDTMDQVDCIKKYGMRVIERFAAAGVLDFEQSILAHCLHLNAREWDILAESPAWVVQNMESNLNNNVGFFKPERKIKNLLLGTDGMHSDMLRSARAAYLAGQHRENVSPAEMYGRLRRIHAYTKSNGFSGDGGNNLVILDYDSPTEINRDNFLSHFIYGMESRHIESVISNGKLVVKKRKLTTIDEEEILSFSKKKARELWRRLLVF